jgi:hypothetical protein
MKSIFSFWGIVCIVCAATLAWKAALYLVGFARLFTHIIIPALAFSTIGVVVGWPIAKVANVAADSRAGRSESKVREAQARRIEREAKANVQRMAAESKRIESEARRIAAESFVRLAEARRIVVESRHTAVSGHHVVVIDNKTGRIGQYVTPPKQILQQQEPQPYTAIDIIRRIADRIRNTKNAPRFIFAGPTRAGKTFTAMRVTEIIDADYYALDPKESDPEEPWPECVKVVGQGDNWPQMERFFTWIMQHERPRRAALMQTNPAAFKRLPKIVIFVEELLTTLAGAESFSEYYITILTKYSQFGIGVIPITHATTAGAMGFKPGQAQLKECFDAIFRFDYDILTDTRKSYVIMRGQQEIELAPYRHVGGVGTVGVNADRRKRAFNSFDSSDRPDRRPVIMLPEPPKRKYQSVAHRDAVEAYLAGRTPNWICGNLLMGRGKPGYKPNSRDYAELRRILALYAISERRG